MTSPREIIENIRKNEYAIGVKFDNQMKHTFESIKGKLDRTISQLSKDLYSEDIHFVLELIQNADDSNYTDPKISFLKFYIDEEKILIQNNETGFEKKNVEAICDVNRSTKTRKEGYIGEKGIGFKSVFKISDEPHIFSNGFQFQFKSIDEELGLGYIVPYWIDKTPAFIDKFLTNIVLPLKNEVKEELSKFSEIEPELLLFLRRLSKIEIYNKVDDVFHSYSKNKENGNVKITSNEKEDFYRLIESPLKVPENIQEEKRELKETKLVLGFPINENGTAKTDSEQKVFAFLPTRSYGFKFMIQADFLIPASREDIHKDKKWNKWLRDNVSTVFLEAVETFKNDENLKTSFYNYIPIQIKDNFFSEVVEQLKAKLSDSNCVLTESGKWLEPSQIFRASEEIRSLISNDDLINFVDNKEYISLEVQNNTEKQILDFLEIQPFAINNLIEILKNTEWLETKSDEWLTQLYKYLSKQSETNLNLIKKSKIVRLRKKMESSKNKVFFPFSKEQEYGFEDSLPIVKTSTIKENKEFLEKIGVLEPNPFEIIENYILKDFEDTNKEQNWQSKSEEVRIG